MSDPALLLAAWLTGLAGSAHCLGMCGGILGALGVGQGAGVAGFARLVTMNLGRALSYALAGALVGFLGGAVSGLFPQGGPVALRALGGLLVCAIGVQLLLGWRLLVPLERGGARLWRYMTPWLRGLLPVRNAKRALAVGMLWGWIPCGLVYAELAVAATGGGAITGALIMLCFGLGTTVGLSVLAAVFHAAGLGAMPARASALVLIAFGIWMVIPALPV